MRTLHYYLSKELFRVCALSLVALTLVMTILGLIEPLRKGGLAGDQVAKLIVYTMPIMLTLTLPVATLFAATIVYGRFSQDNEFMACRASGVSAWTLLKPAMFMGAVVTVVSLTLSNFVTPSMARSVEKVAKADLRGMIYYEMNSRGFFKREPYAISADWVDTDKDILYGVVVTDTRNPNDVLIVVASSAEVAFDMADDPSTGESDVTVRLNNPLVSRTGTETFGQEEVQPIPPDLLKLPPMTKEKMAFSNWGQLTSTLANPAQYKAVADELQRIAVATEYRVFGEQVVRAITVEHKAYEFKDAGNTFLLKAGSATLRGSTVELKSSDDGKQPVEVTQLRDGVPDTLIIGDTASLVPDEGATALTATPKKGQETLIALELRAKQGVMIRSLQRPADPPIRKADKYAVSRFMLPAAAIQAGKNITLSSIYANPDIVPDVVRTRLDRTIKEVMGGVTGELHSRVAFGVSCLLLVSLGAALGMIFRGGQIISAIAIVVAPAAVLFVMILMGKNMVADPDVQRRFGMTLGLASIWGGIFILCVADVFVYLRLMRR